MSAVELFPPSLEGDATSAAQAAMFASQPVVFPGMPVAGQEGFAPTASEPGQVAGSPAGNMDTNLSQHCAALKQEEDQWKQCRYSVPASGDTTKASYHYNLSGGACQVGEQVGMSTGGLLRGDPIGDKVVKLEGEVASGGGGMTGGSAVSVSGLPVSQPQLCASTKLASLTTDTTALTSTPQTMAPAAQINLPLPPFGMVPFVNSMQWNAGLDNKLPFGMIALQGASNLNLSYPINLGAPTITDTAVQAAAVLHKPSLNLTPAAGVEAVSGWVGIAPSTVATTADALTLASTAASPAQGLDLRGAKDAGVPVEVTQVSSANVTLPGLAFLSGLNSSSTGLEPSPTPTSKKKRPKSGGNPQASSMAKIPRKHRCMKCEYQTDNRSHLKRHENSVHSEIKPYMCYVCSKEFSRTEKIRAHFQRFHPSVDYDPSLVYRNKSPTSSPKPAVMAGVEVSAVRTGPPPDVSTCPSSLLSQPSSTPTTLLTAGLATSLPPTIPHLSSVTMFPGMSELSSLAIPTVMGVTLSPNSHPPAVTLATTSLPSVASAPPTTLGLPSLALTTPGHDGLLSAAPTTTAETSNSPSKALPAKFKCHLCAYMGKDSWHLRRHMSDVHEKIKEFQCPRCTYETSRKHRIISHMKSHGQLDCFYCNYKTADLEPFMAHLKQCTKEHRTAFPCSQCKEHFASQKSLMSHQEREHGRPTYNCERCAAPCDSAVALELHKQTHTPTVSATSQLCGLCGESTGSVEQLQEHMRQNHANLASSLDKDCLSCSVCPFRTSSHLILQSHLQVHSTELSQLADRATWKCPSPGAVSGSLARGAGEQQTCPVCFRAFLSQQALQDHLPEHSAEFICRMCGNVYTQQQELEAHKEHCKMKVSPRAMPHDTAYPTTQKEADGQGACPQAASSASVLEEDQKALRLGKKLSSSEEEDYISAILNAGGLPHVPASLPHVPASLPHVPASLPHVPVSQTAPTSVETPLPTPDLSVSNLVTSSMSSLPLPPPSPMPMDTSLSAHDLPLPSMSVTAVQMTSSYSTSLLLTSPSSYAQGSLTTYSTSATSPTSDFTLLGQPPSSNASSLPSAQVLI